MKKLIALISTQGKSSKQIVNEVWKASKKYKKTKLPTVILQQKGYSPPSKENTGRGL